jgi:1-acyl-sn-glycerol-3-phosphate acyltransferase
VQRQEADLAGRVEGVVRRVTGRSSGALDVDSLGAADLVLALEEELGIRLDDAAPRTVEEAMEWCRKAEAGRAAPVLGPDIGHLQWLSDSLLETPLRAYFRLEVQGVEHVPSTGPVILASNHDSLLDIPFLGIAAPRRVVFMAKRELFAPGFATWFFHVLGGFPVVRSGPDVRAVRAGLEVLAEGRALGMYPEGTRSRDFLPFRPGAAWLALASGAPLVPVGVTGTAAAMPRGSRFPRRSRVRVGFGEPMSPGREDDPRARLRRAREVTDELRVRVSGLLGLP